MVYNPLAFIVALSWSQASHSPFDRLMISRQYLSASYMVSETLFKSF